MIVNETMYQAKVSGKTGHSFSFPLKDSLDIFGLDIDDTLRFDNYVSTICKRINGQFNVMLRFRKPLLRLYKAFTIILCCSFVWHFCDVRTTEEIDTLNKRILTDLSCRSIILHDSLLTKVNSKSLYKRRLQTFLIILYKRLFFTCYPGYLWNMFSLRSVSYSIGYIYGPRRNCFVSVAYK